MMSILKKRPQLWLLDFIKRLVAGHYPIYKKLLEVLLIPVLLLRKLSAGTW